MVGTSPIGLARISPSPRHASAQAATHTSARLASATGVLPHGALVGRLVPGEKTLMEIGPLLLVAGGGSIGTLERSSRP